MSADRDTTRIVRSWLEEGVTSLPDSILDGVLDQLPTNPQRRATWWPARGLFEMNKALTFGVAAAAVVIVTILSVTYLAPSGFSVGGPAETPTPTPSPVALPTSGTDLAAGTYAIDGAFPFRVTFDVPDGWFSCSPGTGEIGACAALSSDPDVVMGIFFLIADNVVADPCDRSLPELEPPVGPSVDDLVTAISDLQGFDVTDATDVTVDGFRGKQFEVTAPDDDGGCPDDGDGGFGTWSTASRTNGVRPGEVNLLRVLDVNGVRLVAAAAYHPAMSPADEVAQIRRVFDSVHVGP
ncbi:MAG: hypothetical protein LC798_20450 [Chloroflexi bacterium]|nr:hypothetical protein [Chloroflexota bacterium]